MIIDSYAHYNVSTYKKPFRYLSYGAEGYTLKEGQWGATVSEIEGCRYPIHGNRKQRSYLVSVEF